MYVLLLKKKTNLLRVPAFLTIVLYMADLVIHWNIPKTPHRPSLPATIGQPVKRKIAFCWLADSGCWEVGMRLIFRFE